MPRFVAVLLAVGLVGCGSDKPPEPVKVQRNFMDRGAPGKATPKPAGGKPPKS
jgi:hypothetical protein